MINQTIFSLCPFKILIYPIIYSQHKTDVECNSGRALRFKVPIDARSPTLLSMHAYNI